MDVSAPHKTVKVSRIFSCNIDGVKHASGVNFDAKPGEINFWFKVFNKELLNVKSKINLSKGSQVTDTEIDIYGSRTIVSHAEIKNYNTIHYTLARKGS